MNVGKKQLDNKFEQPNDDVECGALYQTRNKQSTI